jgi:hypothetical protein
MITLSQSFTPYVGVAPGTTTFADRGYNPGGELSCGSCRQPVAGVSGLGVCQPGHYGPAIMLPGSAPTPMPLAGTHWMPYATESRLSGSGIRWDLFALTLGLGFAGVLGYALYRRRK